MGREDDAQAASMRKDKNVNKHPDERERRTSSPLAFVTVAVIVSVIMLGVVLLHSEGQSSTRAVPPLPQEIVKKVASPPAASNAKRWVASSNEASPRVRPTDVDADRHETHMGDDGTQTHDSDQLRPVEAPLQPTQPPTDSAAVSPNTTPQGPNPEAELPVVAPPRPATLTPTPAGSMATPSSSALENADPLERIRQYVAPGTRQGMSGERLPIATPPPVAVPRELAQATPKPTATPSVFQRSRNIPTQLIVTPLPILTNSPSDSGDSPAADPSLATDAGRAPRWSDPQHPIMKEVWGGQPPVPTVPSGTPRVAPVLDTPQPPRQNRATPAASELQPETLPGAPRATAAAHATRGVVESNEPTPHERETIATPRPSGTPLPSPTPSLSAEPDRTPKQGTPASEISPSGRPDAITTPRLYEKEIHTTSEFTVRKKGVTVTFHNVPVEVVAVQRETSAPQDAQSFDQPPPALPPEKLTQPPSDVQQGESALSEHPTELTPTPEAQRLERGIEELARRDDKSPLTRRLASRAIPASVGDKLLTREDISRHVRAIELLRGTTFDEDARMRAEDAVVQEWVERTALAALARERGLNVTEEEINAEIEKRKARFGQNLPAALREAGFSDREVRDEIANALLVDKLVAKIMEESYPEDKLREIYEANPDRYQPSRRLHVREIFKQKVAGREREARQAIERIRMEIAKGATFEELARRESDSPTREAGGDLGWIDASMPVSPRQAQALLNIKPGEVTDIIELGDGYQILKLVEIEEPKPGFEGARQEVVKAVRQEIVARAFEEALAHFDVRVRNKRIPSRLNTVAPSVRPPQPSTPSSGGKEKRVSEGAKSAPSIASKTSEASREGGANQVTTTATPPSKAESKKPRLFPFLKKRQDQ